MGSDGGLPVVQSETNTHSRTNTFSSIRLLHIPDSFLSCAPTWHPILQMLRNIGCIICKCIFSAG